MSQELAEGALVGGRYRLIELVGTGGMGRIYRAQDERLGRPVAIKLLLASVMERENAEDRFLREARVGAQMSHSNLVQTYDFGSESGFLFLVMEFLAGIDLSDALTQDGPLSIEDAVEVALQVASGMELAHGKGLLHRDIKPENIFLVQRTPPKCKVVDFGMAIATDMSSKMARITAEGLVGGTPWYMSPEMVRGEAPAAPSDVYALGCVLYQALCGEPPFNSGGLAVIMAHHMYTPIPEITEKRPDTPQILSELLRRCLAKNPIDRPTMGHIKQRLEAMQGRVLTPTRGLEESRPSPSESEAPCEDVEWAAEAAAKRVNLRGVADESILLALRTAGFALIPDAEAQPRDLIVCLQWSNEELGRLSAKGFHLVADAEPGDTDRIAKLLRLGVREVLPRPVQCEDVVSKVRRAYRTLERQQKAGQT